MNKTRFELKHSVGKIGDEESDFKRPMGIALDARNNNAYIVDEGNRCVLVYTQEGEFLFRFPKSPLSLRGARGICIKFNRVFISEEFLSLISVFSMGGDFITGFNGKSRFHSNFYVPTGLTLDDKGNIYVCDCFIHRIVIFTNELIPQCNVLDLTKHVYIISMLDIKILNEYLIVLDMEGIRMINSVSEENRILINNKAGVKNPIFFDTDQKGNIYISDMDNHCIKIFSNRGKLLNVIGGGMFTSPTGIALSSDTRTIVSVSRKEEGPLKIFKLIKCNQYI